VFLLLRRLLLQVVAALAPAAYRLGLRCACAILIITFFLALQSRISPFEFEYMNMLESATLFVGVLTLVAAFTVAMVTNNPFEEQSAADAATVIAVVANLCLGDVRSNGSTLDS
jgi:hypothetical protein